MNHGGWGKELDVSRSVYSSIPGLVLSFCATQTFTWYHNSFAALVLDMHLSLL